MDLDFRLNQTSLKHLILNQNSLCGIAQKIEETKKQEEEMQKAKARWLMEAKVVQLNLVFIFGMKIIHSLDYLPGFCFHIWNDKIQFFL